MIFFLPADLQDKLVTGLTTSLADVEEEDQILAEEPSWPPAHVKPLTQPPERLSHTSVFYEQDCLPRANAPPIARETYGRANRPLPTTLLFRDVEAQAIAANAALRQAASSRGDNIHGRDSEAAASERTSGGLRMKLTMKKKRSISRARIGAPRLVSASSNLASLELGDVGSVHRDRSRVVSPEPEVTKPVGLSKLMKPATPPPVSSTRPSLKFRLRKKKTADFNNPTSSGSGPIPLVENWMTSGIMSPGPDYAPSTSDPDHVVNRASFPFKPPPVSSSVSLKEVPSSGSNRSHSKEWEDCRISLIDASSSIDFRAGGEVNNSQSVLKHSIRRLLSGKSQPRSGSVVSLSGTCSSSIDPDQRIMRAGNVVKEDPEPAPHVQHASQSPRRPADVDAVAPLKIMKVFTSGKDGVIDQALPTRNRSDPIPEEASPSSTGVMTSIPSLLPPARILGACLEAESRPSTDSVQRLLTDLGLPPRPRDDVNRFAVKDHLRSSMHGSPEQSGTKVDSNEHNADEEDYDASSFERPNSASSNSNSIDQARTEDNTFKTDFECDEPTDDMAQVNDQVAAPTHEPRAPTFRLSQASFLVTAGEVARRSKAEDERTHDTVTFQEDEREAPRSDYAASILDLYDRPESRHSQESGASPIERNQANCARGQSFLDISPSPTTSYMRLPAKIPRRPEQPPLPPPAMPQSALVEDDVMSFMNRFRRDVSSSRVSTGSALFDPPSQTPVSSSHSHPAQGKAEATWRKTMVAGQEDREDEEQAWKMILGR